MKINICGVEFKNPVFTASGPFGTGKEYASFVDLNSLGAIITQGISAKPIEGYATPRVAETFGGMLNSIGWQNPGVESFKKLDLKFLSKYDTKIIVNVVGHNVQEFLEVVEALNDTDVAMFELNLMHPKIGCDTIGTSIEEISKIVSQVKSITKKPIIAKLNPNVTDIVSIAKAAELAGADAISLINTMLGMKININRKIPYLKNGIGNFSGPAIKPIAIRMVYEVRRETELPIIGMGGISTGDDAVEFMLAGSNAVAIGSSVFKNPNVFAEVNQGIENYMNKFKFNDVNELVSLAQQK